MATATGNGNGKRGVTDSCTHTVSWCDRVSIAPDQILAKILVTLVAENGLWKVVGDDADASSPCSILLQILPGGMVASCRVISLRASLLPSSKLEYHETVSQKKRTACPEFLKWCS
ncbi:hypothetical protein WN943_004362 [Citrus x changshan-huyou]